MRIRYCNHPYNNVYTKKPTVMIPCKCGFSLICPDCGYGTNAYPCTCNSRNITEIGQYSPKNSKFDENK